jgi:hypothetical protein
LPTQVYQDEQRTAVTCVMTRAHFIRKGAEEVMRRLQALDDAQQWQDATGPAEDIVGDVVARERF